MRQRQAFLVGDMGRGGVPHADIYYYFSLLLVTAASWPGLQSDLCHLFSVSTSQIRVLLVTLNI